MKRLGRIREKVVKLYLRIRKGEQIGRKDKNIEVFQSESHHSTNINEALDDGKDH